MWPLVTTLAPLSSRWHRRNRLLNFSIYRSPLVSRSQQHHEFFDLVEDYSIRRYVVKLHVQQSPITTILQLIDVRLKVTLGIVLIYVVTIVRGILLSIAQMLEAGILGRRMIRFLIGSLA